MLGCHLQVYKLYGGAHGFLISTAVAEPDEAHAATLLRFALHLHQTMQNVSAPAARLLAEPAGQPAALFRGQATCGVLQPC